jgi:hypothetical protein
MNTGGVVLPLSMTIGIAPQNGHGLSCLSTSLLVTKTSSR